jgi:CRISPR-associated endonuclease/helicase Cas3
MNENEFARTFAALTGNPPFPWQEKLYQRFSEGNIPASCNLPTGLGKTSVVAIWLIALANHPEKTPRRLVYIVNRRTVVDQTTDEVKTLRRNLQIQPALESLKTNVGTLAISTLRGQFADNGEWRDDPARPAVICGTVDMIGSGLLFSGYRCGFKSKPTRAGLLGQDTLIVHDEAHLEPAFQDLLGSINSQQRAGDRRNDRSVQVLELTATSRTDDGQQNPFGLTDPDYKNEIVQQRIFAKKGIAFHAIEDPKEKLDAAVAEKALEDVYKNSKQAILIYLRKVEDVNKVVDALRKEFKGQENIETLTGTLRGKERDELVEKPVFQRFLPEPSRSKGVPPKEGTVYLVCTSAGEVGVNISAGHLICDLTPFDSMAQRFGRVNP